MNITIDPKYLSAVQNFVWPDLPESASLPISSQDLDTLIKEVRDKILAASQLKENFLKNLPLINVCYLSIQHLDKTNNLDTVSRIENVTDKEKIILTHIVKKLPEVFPQVTQDDLKAATLLFVIHRTHEFATSKIIAMPPQTSQIQQMEAELNALINERNRFAVGMSNEAVNTFLLTVDKEIKKRTDIIAALKESCKSIETEPREKIS